MPARRPLPFYVTDGDPPSKQAILQAGLGLFARYGVDATNVRAIGERAGYSNPAIFKFFASKDELALYLFERCYSRLHDVVAGALASDRAFEDNLRALLEAVLALLDEDIDAFLFVQDHLREMWPRTSRSLRRKSLVRLVERFVGQGQSAGAVRGDVGPALLSTALMGFLVQFARVFYFGEIKGRALDRLDEVERIAHGILAA